MPRLSELDEEEAVEEPPPNPKTAPRPFQCPECPHEETDLAKAPAHMESHRGIGKVIYHKNGKMLSKACSVGCGRFFTSYANMEPGDEEGLYNSVRELPHHESICDGSPPYVKPEPKKEETTSMAKNTKDIPGCYYHPDLRFPTGRSRGAHLKNEHVGWKKDPKLNLKLGGAAEESESRALSLEKTPGPGGSGLIPAGDTAILSVDEILSLDTKTADQVLELAKAHRARALHHAQRASDLEVYAKRIKDDMRA